MLIKKAPGERHPRFRIINLSAGAVMPLACSIDFSFLMVNLSDY